MKICITDDSEIFRAGLVLLLQELGYDIAFTASNGQELINQLETADPLPAICLIDVNMPVMDGPETARLVRSRWSSIKILAMSFDKTRDAIITMLQSGAHAFLGKHSPAEEWQQAIESLLTKGHYLDDQAAIILFDYVRNYNRKKS